MMTWGGRSMAKVTGQPLVHFWHWKQAEIFSPLRSSSFFRRAAWGATGAAARLSVGTSIDISPRYQGETAGAEERGCLAGFTFAVRRRQVRGNCLSRSRPKRFNYLS